MNDVESPSCPSAPAPLAGVRIVEAASFVAGPSAGMALAQLGADVVRVDPPGGGSDALRWPLSTDGHSLFWASLNKGKRSIAVDHRRPEGREILLRLACAPGPEHGVFVDNMVGKHRLTYAELRACREDVIHVHLEGRRDGSPAVDYTINAEVGVPQMTGPEETRAPVNHVVPAWDLLTGMSVATHVIAALYRRAAIGVGAQVDLALADVALAGVGNMGWLAEAEAVGGPRRRHGNHMFGSFGTDFTTSDGRRVMVVALTEGQWKALESVTETRDVFTALAHALDADLTLERDRYRLRETIAAVLRPWFEQRDFAAVTRLLTEAHVLWSPYLDMREAAQRARREAVLAHEIDQPGIGPMLATGSPARWDRTVQAPVPAPLIGADTEQVLLGDLGMSSHEYGRLVEAGVVAGGAS